MSEEIPVLEPSDIPGGPKAPRGVVNQPERQSQDDLYVNYRDMNPYTFLYECQTGAGGFSGNVRSKANKVVNTVVGYFKDVYTYITANPTENFFQTRVKRSVYINYFKKYIKAKYKDLFALKEINTTVVIEGKVQEKHNYLKFAENVTGGGMGLIEYTKNALNCSWRDATTFLLMDKKESESMPYAHKKNAIEVACDENGPLITTDAKGKMTSITFNEPSRVVDEDIILVRSYWGIDLFKKLESRDKGDTWTVVEEEANTLTYKGEPYLPVEPLISQERESSDDYLPFPDSYAIAEIVLAIYDRGSVLDYLIDKQGHSMLVINGSTDGISNGRDNILAVDTMENKAFQPFFVSPDAKLPEVHANRIEKLVEEMLDMMDDGGVSASAKTATQESGVSKIFTFSAKSTTSKESLRLAMQVKRFLEVSYKVYMNEETAVWESEVSYPTEFTPQSETTFQELEAAADFFSQKQLPLNESSVIRKYIEKLSPNKSQSEIEDLLDEASNKNITE